ncbi:unnamed protein product [Rotaria sordida]|uniref:Uncharacterized protein n=1 Tax=Rotaria sordida TaxID=392033 RepID=A0A814VT63_9BILA|nr:unnamed protein product [Rotaria sordida]CAF1189638.1 unnamed protein product [Rotaria sordida]
MVLIEEVNTISSKLKQQSRYHGSKESLLSKVDSIVCLSFLNVMNIISLAVPITMLTIGIVKRDKCPMEPRIPLFLIVTSAASIVWMTATLVLNFIKLCCVALLSNSIKTKVYIILGIIIFLFCSLTMCWMIVGCVWVFPKKSSVQFTDSTALSTYCDPLLYNFSFIILILQLVGFLLPYPPTQKQSETLDRISPKDFEY